MSFPSILPSCLARADHPNITWEDLKGKGLPESFTKEWFVIVSIFENEEIPAQRKDKREIATFLNANLHTLTARLHSELRRSNGGKLPDGARLIKEKSQKIMASVPFGTTPTTFAVGGAMAAEGSSRRGPDGAAARPRPRSRGRRRLFRRGRSTFQGLRAVWSSGRTKPEYTAASGRHDHSTFRETYTHTVARW
jgi:hypothetical protein